MSAGRAARSTLSSRSANRAWRRRPALLFLGHQVHRAELEGADGGRGSRADVRAHHHDRPGRFGHDVADGAETIELRHLEIHQHEIGRVRPDLPQRIHAVRAPWPPLGTRPSRPPHR